MSSTGIEKKERKESANDESQNRGGTAGKIEYGSTNSNDNVPEHNHKYCYTNGKCKENAKCFDNNEVSQEINKNYFTPIRSEKKLNSFFNGKQQRMAWWTWYVP